MDRTDAAASSGAGVELPSDGDPERASSGRRWRRFGIVLALACGIAAALPMGAYFYNNHPRLSDAAFAERVTEAIERGRAWVRDHPEKLLGQERNIALMVMLQDMGRLDPAPEYTGIVSRFREEPMPPFFWMRLLDPSTRVSSNEMNREIREQYLDNRWIIYALDPSSVELRAADVERLFDPGRWRRRKLAHQLWALWQMQRIAGDPRVSEELLTELSHRLSIEAAIDIRVHDLYCERIAFTLMAGHPEMIRRRWIERIIENQGQDGGWNDLWYGFSSTAAWANDVSNEHTTVLALWALYQVKYRYAAAFGLLSPE